MQLHHMLPAATKPRQPWFSFFETSEYQALSFYLAGWAAENRRYKWCLLSVL